MARKRKELPVLEGINISGVAAEGKAVSKIKWRPEDEKEIVIFIPFGAPGDVVNVKIDRKKNSYAEGHIVEIVVPSDERVESRCKNFGVCGGCKWQHLPYSSQLKYKQQIVEDALRRIGKVELPHVSPILGSADIWRYRNKMEYTFSCKKWRRREELESGKPFEDSSDALGFHIPGSFDKVLHIDSCDLQDELGDDIRNFIYKYAQERGYTFYNIKENHGLLRTLMLRIVSTGEVMVCLSFGEKDYDNIRDILDAVSEKFPMITSLVYTINEKLNDTISDLEIRTWKGRDYLIEEMEGLRFRINAKSFYQTNSRQAYILYKIVRRLAGLDIALEKKPLVYDLYTGTGTIANFVARSASQVIGIEYVSEAIEDAKLNSRENGIDNTIFYAGDMKDVLTDEFVERHGRPEIMIVDPPRVGMHESVVKVILNTEPDVIVYVSCNPSTQARDLALLDEKYRVTDVQPVDMFPHTHHVENVVRLERR
ncbi:MAG: 23S rRNA (uracil(1939)-C(5))-methyltransferase RlmD [Prevotella sp.]|nr:23S rRNA (uracil(1939)-C(5))-methyltransferase RlmD [Bacteroides sp.]MCM1437166.1 23S rRNA (uracil(1939)-C(5))-methyltransferase RlmD [Prevotella sp.]